MTIDDAGSDADHEIEIASLAALGVLDEVDDGQGQRHELLRYLLEQGASHDEIVEAWREKRLPPLVGERLISERGTITTRQAAEQLGISIDDLNKTIRAAGLPVYPPDEPLFNPAEIESVRALLPALELFPKETALQMLRVMGSSLARISDAFVAAYLTTIEARIVAAGGTELDHAKANLDAITVMGGAISSLGTLLRRHMQVAIERSRKARTSGNFETLHLAVGFVDLVGYTSLSGTLEPSELAHLITEFEDIAYDALGALDGRVVKLIGDEVMFVALDPAVAVDVALTLVRTAGERDARIMPRGGVAMGELLSHEGDYFGPVVNLASRIADLAVAPEVLITEPVHDALDAKGSELPIEAAGRRQLKGFVDPVRLWSITVPGD